MAGLSRKQIASIAEYSKRKVFALELFRAYQNQDPIFLDRATESLVDGGNRSGKTLSCAVKFGALAMDLPVYLSDGTQAHVRRDHQRNRCLLMWVFGLDMNHIGKTIHRALFRSDPPMFYIIRDEETGAWRAYEEWRDSERKLERKPAPPIIPPSWIEPNSWSWENKAARNFEKVVIRNPYTGQRTAEIRAWSSMADEPPAGDPVDVIWIDETIKKPEFYSEYYARLLDNQGFIYWSSFPGRTGATCAERLDDLRLRAVKSREDGSNRVSHFSLPTDENPHFPKEQIEEWAQGFSEEEYKIRVKGESQTSTLLMYPRFNEKVHAAIIDGPNEDEISRILRQRAGEPPEDWMRELILDPGTNKPAVLLCAVPPPHLGHYYIPYRQVYTSGLDAAAMAPEVVKAIAGYEIERMIIDAHAGRTKPMGFGLTVQKNYENEFGARGIKSRSRGCRFIPGSDDVAGRISEVISGLKPAPGSRFPQIRIVIDACPDLVTQMKRYRKELRSGDILDWRPAKHQDIDLAVCLEYGVSRKPFYVQPSGAARVTAVDRMFYSLRQRFSKGKPTTSNTCQIGGNV